MINSFKAQISLTVVVKLFLTFLLKLNQLPTANNFFKSCTYKCEQLKDSQRGKHKWLCYDFFLFLVIAC